MCTSRLIGCNVRHFRTDSENKEIFLVKGKKTKKQKTGMVRCEIIKTDINYSKMAVQHYRRYIYRHILCKECYATKCQQNIVVIVSQNSVELFFLRRVQQRTHCKIRLYQRLTGTKLKISATKLPKAA